MAVLKIRRFSGWCGVLPQALLDLFYLFASCLINSLAVFPRASFFVPRPSCVIWECDGLSFSAALDRFLSFRLLLGESELETVSNYHTAFFPKSSPKLAGVFTYFNCALRSPRCVVDVPAIYVEQLVIRIFKWALYLAYFFKDV